MTKTTQQIREEFNQLLYECEDNYKIGDDFAAIDARNSFFNWILDNFTPKSEGDSTENFEPKNK